MGDARLDVRTTSADEVRPEYDVVFLACKAYDLDSAVEAIAPAIKEGAKLLPLLNGMSRYDLLAGRFGREAVPGGTCTLQVSLGEDGVIHHSGPFQRIVFGERGPAQSDAIEFLARTYARSKADWVHAADIDQELWEKIVFLSAMAATTSMMQSVFTGQSGPLTASMLRDVERGHAVEADHIVGWMLGRARTHGVDDAILSLAYVNLKAYEARRAAGRLGPS